MPKTIICYTESNEDLKRTVELLAKVLPEEQFWTPEIIVIRVSQPLLKFAQVSSRELLPAKRGAFLMQG